MDSDLQTIPEIIAEQIGHHAFVMMGTTQKVVDSETSLIFNYGRSMKKKIKINLNVALDTYEVTFYKIGPSPHFKVKEKTYYDIHVWQLKSLIERETGLYLSLF